MTSHHSTDKAQSPMTGGLAERLPLSTQKIHARFAADATAHDGEVQSLEPAFIPGMIEGLKTEGADGGVNHAMLLSHNSGLLISILRYMNMREGDWVRVYWGDDSTPVASDGILEENLDEEIFSMYVPAGRVPEGLNSLYYIVTRAGSGNQERSLPLNILVRTLYPGGTDPEPDTPSHELLAAPLPDLPDSGIIDEDAAKDGIVVTIEQYPNMRVYDTIMLSWGGEMVEHEVTQAEADAGSVDILVAEATILAAGAGDPVVLVYWVLDEVHNRSSGWSLRTEVIVEVGEDLLEAPVIHNPDPDAEFQDVIDLDKIGDADVDIDIMVLRGTGIEAGDMVELTWVGTTSQGLPVIVEFEPEEVNKAPPTVVSFILPNASLLSLAQGRGVASYVITRDGSAVGASKRAVVSFIGVEKRLPKPVVSDVVNGALDPTLASVTVTVAGDSLEGGDTLYITWLGTRSNGTPLLEEFRRSISGGNAGKPVTVTITGETLIAPLNGGTVSVYYRLVKFAGGTSLESDRELLMVGEAQFELPAPFTRPPSDSGALDPEDIVDQLEIVILPYPSMQAGQVLHLSWRASGGGQHSDFLPISQPIEGQTVTFYMDRSLVEEFLGEDIEVTYRVEQSGEPTRLSAPAKFTVGAKAAPLPVPEVVEAQDGVLNPADALDGATVRIPVEAGLEAGDDVEVTWSGSKPGGVSTVSRLVLAEHVGKPFDLTVDYQYVDVNADGTVVVSYKVFKQNGNVPTSAALTLSVQRSSLPLPVILQAEDDQLNPDDVLQGATVRINAAAQFKAGDVVTVVVASRVAGGSTSIPYTVPSGGGGQPVQVTIPYNIVNASNGSDFDLAYEIQRAAGGPVEPSGSVTYYVNREVGSGPLRVMGARFNVNTYRASGSPRMISAFHDATLLPMLAEWRYEGESQWTARSHWFDNKPWLKLYVRSDSQTIELRPCNVVGNGVDTTANGSAAFAVMRDEVLVGSELEVDMRAWGNASYGGSLTPTQITLKNVAEITGSSNGYVARLRDGYVVRWGGAADVPQNGNYAQVRSNAQAFCGRLTDGTLVAWGPATHGVPVSEAALAHKDYVEVVGAATAFAARRASGHVVAWGNPAMGGKMKEGQEVLGNIIQLAGNYGAFAALRDGGGSKSVIAWGHDSYGGDASKVAGLTNVKALGAATAQAFSILLDDGSVQAWGPESHGGVVPSDILAMRDIVEITSTWHAMCARRASGHVVAWGNPANGGNVGEDIAVIRDIVSVVGSSWSFAALRRNGTVVAWGMPATGGDTSAVAAQLVNVRAIYANSHGFTALTSDGRVVTWGVPAGGGDSSLVQHELTGKLGHSRVVPAEEAAQLGLTATNDQGQA